MQSRRTNAIHFALFVVFPLLVLAFAASGRERVRFMPRFSPGEVLRYRIESRTTTSGTTTTPITNPEGGSQSTQSIHIVVRLDVLSVSPAGEVRLRATYEKSSSESESDALDLQASSNADRYNRLEGRSFEFSIEPGGTFAAMPDSAAAPSGQPSDEPVLSWLQGLSAGSGFPQKGVAIGQKWNTERPLAGALLSGLLSRTESTYLRDEPCRPSALPKVSGTQSTTPPGDCAVILTRFQILRRGPTHSDATPEDYRRNGLRTTGTWTGSGESLDSISLSTGLLVGSTQNSVQNMDYEISSASTGSSIHHVGKVQAQSEITLMPDQP
ncbi:MAG: hypothetical protein WB949_15315 [Candidatus Acidiferrales bacterium]